MWGYGLRVDTVCCAEGDFFSTERLMARPEVYTGRGQLNEAYRLEAFCGRRVLEAESQCDALEDLLPRILHV